MKKKIGIAIGALVTIFIIGFIGFKIGYNEGALDTAWKYGNMSYGFVDQFNDDADISNEHDKLENVQKATDEEISARGGKQSVYTGNFLFSKNK